VEVGVGKGTGEGRGMQRDLIQHLEGRQGRGRREGSVRLYVASATNGLSAVANGKKVKRGVHEEVQSPKAY
jgi:hypothetical protein